MRSARSAPTGEALKGLQRTGIPKDKSVTFDKTSPMVALPAGIPVLYVWGDASVTPAGTVTLVKQFQSKVDADSYFKKILEFLNVEFLIQSGSTTELGPNDHDSGDHLGSDTLLAPVRLACARQSNSD